MYIFNVDTDLWGARLIGEILIIIGVVVLVILMAYFFRNRRKREEAIRVFSRVMVVFVVFMITGSTLYFLNNSSSSQIIIGKNSVTVSAEFIGNNTYSTSQITYAYVENINTGNITLSARDMGSSLGSINEGRYTLSNGAKADVVTNNATVLVVSLSAGTYLVLGCDNTTNMAQDFASNVYPVAGL